MSAPIVETVSRSYRARAKDAMRAPWCRLVREADAPAYAAERVKIKTPADVVRLLQPRAAREEVEVFYVVALDTQSNVIGLVETGRGILNSCIAHPRETFRVAVALGAAGIIVAHNHPSGDPTPSPNDKAVTRQLVEAGRVLDIPVYDHVILGCNGRYVSCAEAGLL